MKIKRSVFIGLLGSLLVILLWMFASVNGWAQDRVNTKEVHVVDAAPVTQVMNASIGTKVPGSRSLYYWVVSKDAAGNTSLPSGPFYTKYAPTIVSAANPISLTFQPIKGIVSYDVLRTTNNTPPTGDCACAVASGIKSTSLIDKSENLNAYTVNDAGYEWVLMNERIDGTSTFVGRYAGNRVLSIDKNGLKVGNAVFDANSPINVRKYGAEGDGTTDDSIAIKTAIASALASSNGKEVVFSSGLYRVTQPIHVGLPIFDSYSWIVDRTAPMDDPTYAAHVINENVLINNSKPAITIRFEQGAKIVADFTATEPTPVLSYNLRNGEGRIIDPVILGTTAVSNGKEVTPSTKAANNLIGIVGVLGLKEIRSPRTSGIEYGVATAAAYWSLITNSKCLKGTGGCLNLAGANASHVINTLAVDMGAGTVVDGDSMFVAGMHTEQTGNELVVLRADASTFIDAYFEDVETEDGANTYAVTLGTSENGTQVLQSVFQNIRVGNLRPNKKAFRIWSSKNVIFNSNRSFGRGIDVDTVSYGLLNANDGGDFDNTTTLPASRWVRPGGTAMGNITTTQITNTGDLYQGSSAYIKSATPSTGYALIVPGSATTTGRYELWDTAGVRIGYMGDDNGNLKFTANKGQMKFSATNGFVFDGDVILNNKLKLGSVASYTCNSAARGHLNYIAGAAGAKDILQVCTKDAADAYAWRTIY